MDILSFLESRHCYFCGCYCVEPSHICRICQKDIEENVLIKGSRCQGCSMPIHPHACECHFCSSRPPKPDEYFSLGFFNGVLKEIVQVYKSGSMPGFAWLLAQWLYQAFLERGWTSFPVVPVPPRKGKIKKSGWDQIAWLCTFLRRQHGMTVINCLKRTDRIQQTTLAYCSRVLASEFDGSIKSAVLCTVI